MLKEELEAYEYEVFPFQGAVSSFAYAKEHHHDCIGRILYMMENMSHWESRKLLHRPVTFFEWGLGLGVDDRTSGFLCETGGLNDRTSGFLGETRGLDDRTGGFLDETSELDDRTSGFLSETSGLDDRMSGFLAETSEVAAGTGGFLTHTAKSPRRNGRHLFHLYTVFTLLPYCLYTFPLY
ncbi:hypothetical protein [Sporosarcina gallistercoris]|uniref:Uncharacterized protein n=1 Tax=Sporosarcina gallistercoris TaxID=2762245 RepID=A0ABR8PH26_9BACL|nr:hypothetical protein [Sporosarcina gallistercoris]MBD7907475.1 hypothetical protein [Sporosarcina gallistercoris]